LLWRRRGGAQQTQTWSPSGSPTEEDPDYQTLFKCRREKKQKRAKFKDKQGFTWTPFITADEELPMPRVPCPHIKPINHPDEEAPKVCNISSQQETPIMSKPSTTRSQEPPPTSTSLPSSPQIIHNPKPLNGDIVRPPPRTLHRQQLKSPVLPVARSPMARLKSGQLPRSRTKDSETGSFQSIHSDNSFQTASSDVPVNFIPKQIKDNYKTVPPGTAALERKSSVLALQQQQYNALSAELEGANKAVHAQMQPSTGNKTQSKLSR